MTTPLFHNTIKLLALLLFIAAGTGAASAQLTSEQQSAMRSNCRGDFMSKCSGVSPGGKEALTCLQSNVATLSAGCQAVVKGTMPKPTPAAAPAPKAEPKPRVQTAPPPAAAPAPAQTTAVPSPSAPAAPPPPKAAVAKPAAKPASKPATKPPSAPAKPVAVAPAAPVVAAPAPPPAAAPGGPSPQQMNAIKFTCRGDFGRYCKGVQAGGPAALGCLQRNAPRLSANCKTALADVADELPPAPTAVAAPPAAVPPPAARPKAPVANAVVMLRACKLDLIRHCRGIPVGTESACLTAHEAGLTVRCRMARKVTAPLR